MNGSRSLSSDLIFQRLGTWVPTYWRGVKELEVKPSRLNVVNFDL